MSKLLLEALLTMSCQLANEASASSDITIDNVVNYLDNLIDTGGNAASQTNHQPQQQVYERGLPPSHRYFLIVA